MSCMTLFALPTMATTQLAQVACRESSGIWPMNFILDRKPALSMSWVVVTDENGNRSLRMRWSVSEERTG